MAVEDYPGYEDYLYPEENELSYRRAASFFIKCCVIGGSIPLKEALALRQQMFDNIHERFNHASEEIQDA